MTREEAISILHTGIINYDDVKKYQKAMNMALKSLELLGHLKDRPCSACEFRKETGCCKWSCVFEEV